MARKVVLLDSASADLTELGLYIASQSGAQVANDYLDRIYATCMGLATFPERGRRRDDVLPGLRTIGFERRVTIGSGCSKNRCKSLRLPTVDGISRVNCAKASSAGRLGIPRK